MNIKTYFVLVLDITLKLSIKKTRKNIIWCWHLNFFLNLMWYNNIANVFFVGKSRTIILFCLYNVKFKIRYAILFYDNKIHRPKVYYCDFKSYIYIKLWFCRNIRPGRYYPTVCAFFNPLLYIYIYIYTKDGVYSQFYYFLSIALIYNLGKN